MRTKSMKEKSLAYEIAQFIIDDGTTNSSSSNWNTDFEEIEDRFGINSLANNSDLLEKITEELEVQIEVLDIEIDVENESFDIVYGTLFCQNYDPSNSDPTGWNSILINEKSEKNEQYYHIFSAFSNTSLMTFVTGEKDGQHFDKSKIPEISFKRLENQFGISDRYNIIAEVDRDTGMIRVEHNDAFYTSNGLEQPMDYSIKIHDMHSVLQELKNKHGQNLARPTTQFRIEEDYESEVFSVIEHENSQDLIEESLEPTMNL